MCVHYVSDPDGSSLFPQLPTEKTEPVRRSSRSAAKSGCSKMQVSDTFRFPLLFPHLVSLSGVVSRRVAPLCGAAQITVDTQFLFDGTSPAVIGSTLPASVPFQFCICDPAQGGEKNGLFSSRDSLIIPPFLSRSFVSQWKCKGAFTPRAERIFLWHNSVAACHILLCFGIKPKISEKFKYFNPS